MSNGFSLNITPIKRKSVNSVYKPNVDPSLKKTDMTIDEINYNNPDLNQTDISQQSIQQENWKQIFEAEKEYASSLSANCKETYEALMKEKDDLEKQYFQFQLNKDNGLVYDELGLAYTPTGYLDYLTKSLNPDDFDTYENGVPTNHYDEKLNEIKEYIEKNYAPLFNSAFLSQMGMSYEDYQKKINTLDSDILTLKSTKYALDQQVKEYPYKAITVSEDYQNFVRNYTNDFNTETIDINSPIPVGIDPVKVADALLEENKNLDQYPYLFFNSSLIRKERYEALSEENKMMYHYLFEKEGFKAAENYLKEIEDSINKMEGIKEGQKFIDSITNEDGQIDTNAINILKTSGKGFGDGIDNFAEGLSNIFKTEGIISTNQYAQMTILDALNKKIFLTGTYEISTSAGNMAPSIAASAIASVVATPASASTIGYSLSGTSIMGNAKNRALVSGNDMLSSTVYGALNGVSELTLGKLLGNVGFMNPNASFTVRRILNEGTEELLQEYVDAGLRSTLLNETIDINELTTNGGKSFLYGIILSSATIGMQKATNILCNGKNYSLTMEEIAELTEILESHPDNQEMVIEDYLNSLNKVNNTPIENDESSFHVEDMEIEPNVEEYNQLSSVEQDMGDFQLPKYNQKFSIPFDLKKTYYNLRQLVYKINSIIIAEKETYSKPFRVEDINIEETFEEYNQLLNSDSRLKSLMEKSKLGETLMIPIDLEEAFISLKQAKFKIDLYVENNERIQSLNKFETVEQIYEEYELLMKKQELVDLDNAIKKNEMKTFPEHLVNDYIRLQELRLKLNEICDAQATLDEFVQEFKVSSVKKEYQSLIKLLEDYPRLKRYVFGNSSDSMVVPDELLQQYEQLRIHINIIEENGYPNFSSNLKKMISMPIVREYYTVSDLHGDIRLFNQIKQKLQDNPNAHFYILGDAMDRGKYGLEILLQIKELSEAGKIDYLPGNHDIEFYHYMRGLVDKNQNTLFENAKGFYRVNRSYNEMNRLDNFDHVVDEFYNQGIIKKKIPLKELSDWLGSQPIQKAITINEKKYAMAHAIFDANLYIEDSNFNLSKFYDLELSNNNQEKLNRALNVFWYRKEDESSQHAKISYPENFEMIVGHTPQKTANRQSLDKDGKYYANFIDTHNHDFSAFKLNDGTTRSVHEIISNKLMDQLLMDSPERLKVEKLKVNEWLFNENLKKLSNSLSVKNDIEAVSFFCKALKNIYKYVDDVQVEYIIENLNLLENISLNRNTAGVTIKYSTTNSFVNIFERSVYLSYSDLTSGNYQNLTQVLGYILLSLDDNLLPSNYNEIMKQAKNNIQKVSGNQIEQYLEKNNAIYQDRIQEYINGIKTDKKLYREIYEYSLNQIEQLDINDIPKYFAALGVNIDLNGSTKDQVASFITNREVHQFASSLASFENYGLSSIQNIISSVNQSKKVTLENGASFQTLFGHSDNYYTQNKNNVYREMFVNYFQLKINGNTDEINLLKSFLGNDWYQMMEQQLTKIIIKMEGIKR